MFCMNCGKELSDDAVFCGYCGQRMEPAPSASQETVVVPEIPTGPVTPDPAVDGSTRVVPEIPDVVDPPKDPLEEMYPDRPAKKSKAGLIIGLIVAAILLISIVVVVILGVMNDWWQEKDEGDQSDSTSSSTTEATEPEEDPTDSPEDDSQDEQPTADELRQRLEVYNAGGLLVYLHQDFREVSNDENGAQFKLRREVELSVSFGPLEDIETAEDLARHFKKDLEGDIAELSTTEYNGTPCVLVIFEEGDAMLSGFYVQDGYGWVVSAFTENYEELAEDLNNYVSLCQVDPEFEAPEIEVPDVELEEKGFAGLYLTMDANFEASTQDRHVFYQTEDMTILVQLVALSEVGVETSEDYANGYLSGIENGNWITLEADTLDDSFYYVLSIALNGETEIKGLYTHGDMGWLVTGESTDQDFAEAMLGYIASGRIVPEEIPALEAPTRTVEFSGLTLQLEGTYRETFRNEEYVMLSGGNRDLYVFVHTSVTYGSAAEYAQELYEDYLDEPGDVRLYNIGDVTCLIYWPEGEDAPRMAYGFYMAGNTLWEVQLLEWGDCDDSELLDIVSSAEIDESYVDPFQPSELVQRERIELTDQATAEYIGLQISYGPDWLVDTTQGETGDYKSYWCKMSTTYIPIGEMQPEDAITIAWDMARDQSQYWGNYEVGMAGEVPYVMVYEDGIEYYQLNGIYADDTGCWMITMEFYDWDDLDQAIWYATAGVIL